MIRSRSPPRSKKMWRRYIHTFHVYVPSNAYRIWYKNEKARGRLGGHPEVGLRCTAYGQPWGRAHLARTHRTTHDTGRESAGEWSGERRYQISERELSTAGPRHTPTPRRTRGRRWRRSKYARGVATSTVTVCRTLSAVWGHCKPGPRGPRADSRPCCRFSSAGPSLRPRRASLRVPPPQPERQVRGEVVDAAPVHVLPHLLAHARCQGTGGGAR